ncbi:hypothetical protein TorRG33x02_256400 [Trema orientale]|uniref:Uncharacterized protein n=1 Tax=Trema orientale TaxID=63057 RepID=A0A2P5DBN7_TREOI|nr:hypothetical protein TorRG33x02_256400 [Trema orientale]
MRRRGLEAIEELAVGRLAFGSTVDESRGCGGACVRGERVRNGGGARAVEEADEELVRLVEELGMVEIRVWDLGFRGEVVNKARARMGFRVN